MIKLKNILLESMGNALNESDNATYERRVANAEEFAKDLSKNPDVDVNISFFGYGFNELEPNYFAGEFRIINGDDYDEAYEAISGIYVVDEQGSTADSEIEFDRDRRYYPTIKITGIKDSAEKPEFTVHIDSVDIDNETISPTPQFSSYEDVKDDMRDLLDGPGMLNNRARVEGHVKIGNNKYEFNFETQDPDDDVEPDQIYWQSDSFEQVTELDETDVVAKLNA